VTFLISVIILHLVGEFSKCNHICRDIFGLVLNCGPAASQTTGNPGPDLVLNGLTRVARFPNEISQLVKELIELSILMLDLFPFYDVEVSAKGLTKAGSYEIKKTRPLAV
jgi:hypothetical protein